ncbi:MAG: hypothetical protein ACOVP7_03315 [Lacibacter sp.]
MTSADCAQIHITSEVNDFMFIRVEDPLLEKHSFQYEILTAGGELIRKGVFRGAVIQLRLSHLKDGTYTIVLQYASNKVSLVHSFKKYTLANGEQTMFSF